MKFHLKKIKLSLGISAILSLTGHQASGAPAHPLIQEMVTKIQQMKNSESVCVASAFFRKKGGENCSSYDFAMLGLATCGNYQGFKGSDCGKMISKTLGHWNQSKAITYLVDAIKQNKTDPTALACSVDVSALRGGLKEVAIQACKTTALTPSEPTNTTWKSTTPTGIDANN